MSLDLRSLEKAITAMQQILERAEDPALAARLDEITLKAIRSGAIQHFEFTFDLAWKFIQRWIRTNLTPEDADFPRTRKELFRIAARHGLIADPLPWFAYAEARNITSHTYDEAAAEKVYRTAQRFIEDARYLLDQLEKRND